MISCLCIINKLPTRNHEGMPTHLSYPKLHTIAFLNALINLCNVATHTVDGTVDFDLSKAEFFTPFGIVMLAGTIREC